MALTVEAAAMAQVPLAGTDWIPGKDGADAHRSGRSNPKQAARLREGPDIAAG